MRKLSDTQSLNLKHALEANHHRLNSSFVIEELEKSSWCYLPQIVSPSVCQELFGHYLEKRELFNEAQIGNFTHKQKNRNIRKSLITWIDNWHQSSATIFLNEFYKSLALEIRNAFYIPLKWHESQIALYQEGDYYKKHLDQLKLTKHRQVTTVLFLNDCEKGGELVIYNREDKNKVESIISPQAGGLVVFFSAHIFHEVRHTIGNRMTLTTWMRDDAVPFLDNL